MLILPASLKTSFQSLFVWIVFLPLPLASKMPGSHLQLPENSNEFETLQGIQC